MKVDIGKSFKWRWWQAQLVLKAMTTNVMCYLASRQTGKTRFGRALVLSFMFKYGYRKNPRFVILTPFLEQAIKLYYQELLDEEPGLRELEDKGLITRQGSLQSGTVTMTLKRPWFGDYATIIFAGTQNPSGIRGKTADVLFMDEMAFMAPDIYSEIARPMTKSTRGKIFVCSTVNGYNHFYDFAQLHKEYDNHMGKYFEVDYLTCQFFTLREVVEDLQYHQRLGKLHNFLKEYCNRWDAAAIGEAPFAKIVNSLQARNRVVSDERHVLNSPHIFAVFDRGKPGNNACWVGVIQNRQNGFMNILTRRVTSRL